MKQTKSKISLFLDSGAYSAETQGAVINIDEYIAFIKEHEKHLAVYANLDVLGDPVATLKNQKYMEAAGLNPLPCFHYGEDTSYLKDYVAKYDYVALGGMVPIANKDLLVWLDDMFLNHICGKDGMPKTKIHGFGMTSLPLMFRYPWYSVDSTSWVMGSRMGCVYAPSLVGNKWNYKDALKIVVSSRSPKMELDGQHISTLSPIVRDYVLAYFKDKGYELGKSEFKFIPVNQELTDSQRKTKSKKTINGVEHVEVEDVIEPGLCNRYQDRDELNIIYFSDLEKEIPKWPWAFKMKKKVGFDL